MDNNGFNAPKLAAYDATNTLLGTASITLSRVMSPLQIVADGIQRIVVSTDSPTLVLDDLAFVPSCPPSTNGGPARILAATLHRMSDGQFEFAVAGTVGAHYEIQVSSDLKQWDTMSTLAMTNSPSWCLDSVTNLPCRFYRAKLAR